jgi:hypothetical protein
MANIPLSVKERIFSLLQAREAFKSVVRICAFVEQNKIDREHALYYPLMVSAHVIYSRPFQVNYGFGKLEDLLVPKCKRSVHERTLEYRNRVFAHRHLKQSKKGQAARELLSLHEVFYKVQDRVLYTIVKEDNPPDQALNDLYELSKELLDKVRFQSEKITKQYLRFLPKIEGTYRLVMDDNARIDFECVPDVQLNESTFSRNLPRARRRPEV